ncbi:hypothetical protein Vadar_021863 [Vaccinium darrowii]|uniref:Uncharacterized protein n=1 Tax=Vaccinium darrowii TaxID=229202 RepID=A0ACB7ZM12_9ERIC|nr:hypothetical protein Vadar_021863 [Vaccinium darrowii]
MDLTHFPALRSSSLLRNPSFPVASSVRAVNFVNKGSASAFGVKPVITDTSFGRLGISAVENMDQILLDAEDTTIGEDLDSEIPVCADGPATVPISNSKPLWFECPSKPQGGKTHQEWVRKPIDEGKGQATYIPLSTRKSGTKSGPSSPPARTSSAMRNANSFSALTLHLDTDDEGDSEKGDLAVEEDLDLSPLRDSPSPVVAAPVAKKGRGHGRGILEAKARIDNVAQIAKCCFPSHWSVEHNIPNNRVARMMVAWDGLLLKVAFIHSSSQLMVAKVITEDGSLFFVSFVYGQNLLVERRALWEGMKQISSVVGDNPWIQLGDFNVVRKRSERLVGSMLPWILMIVWILFAWMTCLLRACGSLGQTKEVEWVISRASWIEFL